jgi:DMSO/TMAO reductase YedYZ heme-binding membrane subunit
MAMSSQLWWYTARSGGIVAWALLAASVLWGLALSTKVFGKRPRPNWLLDLHRFLGGLAVVFTAIHVLSIMIDTYVDFGPVEILVPFTGTWHPVAVAWGVISLYLLLAVEITSLLRKRLSRRAWRATHYLSFVLFALATIHALSAGTDRNTVLLRYGVLLTTAAVVVLTAFRATRADQHDLMTAPTTRAPRSMRAPTL